MSEFDWGALTRTPAALLLTLAIAALYPYLGWRRYRRLAARTEPVDRRVRLRLYASIVISQWALVGATVLVLGQGGADLGTIGFGPGPSPAHTALTAVALLAVFAALSRLTLAQLARASTDDLPAHVRRAGLLLPRDGIERAGFVAVAVTAGVCEEILYRGWLPLAIFAWTGSLLAGYLLAAIVFGLGHAYQGRKGVLLTALLGLAFGMITWWSRSLLPAQALHVAIDLVNGIAVGAALTRMDRERLPLQTVPPEP